MSSPLIELENVSFAYGLVPVLENVTMEVLQGEFASIVGPNGGGKTTLVRIMLGLLTPLTGRVRLFGDDPSKTRLNVGYTPQYASVDFQFPITVEEIVLAGRLGVKTSVEKSSFFSKLFSGMRFDDVDRKAAHAAMERMQIADLAARSFGDLSGGQKQRVFIARALAADPQLLILDEPTNNIDPSSMEKFYDLLTELNKTITILVVTHD
ncbi:MAG: ABC transporter ATP-binding protein, partial [Planctomycetia bacterium]|nr:ABC transporter ATP-binding protein [Planctomycetia bacterium]